MTLRWLFTTLTIVTLLVAAGRANGDDVGIKAHPEIIEPPPKRRIIDRPKPWQLCLQAVGFEWCPSKQKCLRPWEELCAELPVRRRPGRHGGRIGTLREARVPWKEHNVIPDPRCEVGFGWCASMNQCVDANEVHCDGPALPAARRFAAQSGRNIGPCLGSAGYEWCPSKNKCLRRWEEHCDELPYRRREDQDGHETQPRNPSQPHAPIGGLKPGEQCLSSAGYAWCPSKNKCLRRWEELCDELPFEPPASEAQRPPIGGKKPGERCLGSAGYEWCPSKTKCLRRWEEHCDELPHKPGKTDEGKLHRELKAPIGGMKPGERCLGAAGYEWCPSKEKCVRRWEESCAELPSGRS